MRALGNGYLDGLFVFGVDDDAAQLAQMAGRHDDRHVVGEGLVDFDAAHAEPVAVGCSQCEALLGEGYFDTGEGRPALIGGGGEDDLIDHLAKPSGFKRDCASFEGFGRFFGPVAVIDGRDHRKLLRVDSFYVGVEVCGAQMECLGAYGQLHFDLVGRQAVDELSQQAGRHGYGAFILDTSADPAVDADLQIGGGQTQLIVLRLQQDVAEHRQRTAGRYRATDDRQALRQILLKAAYAHVCLPYIGSGFCEYWADASAKAFDIGLSTLHFSLILNPYGGVVAHLTI